MGSIHQVEIVVHVDAALDEVQCSDLVDQLQGHEGVAGACFTPSSQHLLLIDYDRDLLSAQDVLGYVKETHARAELVGPI